MLTGIIFILSFILLSIIISFIIPIFITTKIFNFYLTKKEYFEYYIYILFFPISVLFSRSYYKNLVNKNIIKNKLGFFKIISIAIILSSLFSTFITNWIVKKYWTKPFQNEWESMYPAIYDKQFLFTTKILWLNSRGDIIIYKPGTSDIKEYSIGRIIWLPGETIKIENGYVWIMKNWKYSQLEENYLNENSKSLTYVDDSKSEVIYNIPENSYFILWDNRDNSIDSRNCFSSCTNKNNHFVWVSSIVWKYFFDLWYFNITKFDFSHPNLWIETKPKFFDIKKKTQ